MKLRHHVNNTRNLFDDTNMQTRTISSLNQKGMWGGIQRCKLLTLKE